MVKAILVVLLFLLSFASAQIKTDTFTSFWPDTTDGTSTFTIVQDTMALIAWGAASSDYRLDWIGRNGFSESGTITETAGGLMSQTGPTFRLFQGTTDYFHRNTNWYPRTNDFSVIVWIKTPASLSGFKVIGNQRDANGGWSIHTNNTDFASNIISGGTGLAAKVTVAASKHYMGAWKFDRDGNVTCQVFGQGALLTDTTDISSYSAVDLNEGGEFYIGSYAPLVSSNEYDGGVAAFKFSSNDMFTDKEIWEDFFLPEGWYSATGINLYRHISGADSPGWHLSIKNTGGATPQVGIKGNTTSALSAYTGDSTRYTVQIAGVTSLSSDSLIIVCADDSAWVPLPDSTFATGYGLQIVIDAWSLGRLSAPIGAYAVFDNLTVSTYEIPAAASSATWTKSQNRNKYLRRKFKNFVQR